jgi:hypothetical protein
MREWVNKLHSRKEESKECEVFIISKDFAMTDEEMLFSFSLITCPPFCVKIIKNAIDCSS